MGRITTEHEWLTCEDPHELGWFTRGGSNTHRFRWLVVGWGQRIRPLMEPEDLPWFDAFASWVAGDGAHPTHVCPNEVFRPLDYPLPAVSYARHCVDELHRDESMFAAVSAGLSASEHFPRPSPPPADFSKTHRSRTKRKRQQEQAASKSEYEAWWAAKQEHSIRVRRQFCDEFRDVAGNLFRPVILQPG